jgi:hypothetical protein
MFSDSVSQSSIGACYRNVGFPWDIHVYWCLLEAEKTGVYEKR